MNLFPALERAYTKESLSAREAQRMAEYIAWAPLIFQTARVMVKSGILQLIRESAEGLTAGEIAESSGYSLYAVKVLTEASLSAGIILVNKESSRFTISKTGWFLLTDEATRVNMDFNHSVNYRGMYHLEEALKEGRPAGLKSLGDWPTIYQGLSQLPPDAQRDWFAFDHFYSDHSFSSALKLIFSKKCSRIMDVGGNTGRFALKCTEYNPDVKVTVVDLPGQIEMMKRAISGSVGESRIEAFPADLLKSGSKLPQGEWDAIWMSQFLDCFSIEEIASILSKAKEVMGSKSTLYIMETFWDRQKYEPASLCLTMTSLYFTVMANGNSKMYHSDDFLSVIESVGLKVAAIHDGLGHGHSIMEVTL
ncbi:MAG: methyltransferase [Candidatus Egerieousia sp.]|nr:methyltransferase [Candidatus Egerieousia sp.]